MKKIVAAVLILVMAFSFAGCSASDYKAAEKTLEAGDYEAAADAFEALGDYKDSAERAIQCRYDYAQSLFDAEDFAQAAEKFEALGDYSDSADLALECRYQYGLSLFDDNSYEAAIAVLEALGDYCDSADYIVKATDAWYTEKIVGIWVTEETDVIDDIVTSAQFDEETLGFMQFDSFMAAEKMELGDNGTVTGGLDKDLVNASLDKFMEDFRSGFMGYFVQLMKEAAEEEGITYEQILSYCGATDDEGLFEYSTGTTINEYMDLMRSVIESNMSGADYSGTYSVEDGRICFYTAGECQYADYDPEADTITVELPGSTETTVFHRAA